MVNLIIIFQLSNFISFTFRSLNELRILKRDVIDKIEEQLIRRVSAFLKPIDEEEQVYLHRGHNIWYQPVQQANKSA